MRGRRVARHTVHLVLGTTSAHLCHVTDPKFATRDGFFLFETVPVQRATGKERYDCAIRHHREWAFLPSPVLGKTPEEIEHEVRFRPACLSTRVNLSVVSVGAQAAVRKGKIRIALGVPTTSRNARVRHPRELPVFSILFASLVRSLTRCVCRSSGG